MTEIVFKNNGGIGFISLLTLLFIGLKLTNYINWTWFWVLSPILIAIIVIIFILLIIIIINVYKYLLYEV